MTASRIGGLLAALALAACTGEGSDIGPAIPRPPKESFRVLVQDDAGRGVCGAAVTVDGTVALTGRSGRADLPAAPFGTHRVIVAGAVASAIDGDRLGSLAVELAIDSGEVPFVVNLPDLSASAGVTITPGPTAGPIVLDDQATSGAIVTIGAGSQLAFAGASATLRSGPLAARHLPGLPAVAAAARLPGAGAFVAPADLAVSPAAALSMPNDLGAPAGATVPLFRLDPVTGRWVQAGNGTVDPTAARIEGGPVAAGGLHAYLWLGSAATRLVGRVVDASGAARSGVLVRTAGAYGRSDGSGRFVLDGVPLDDAGGGPRTATIELHGGRDLLPVGTAYPAPALAPGQVDAGDLVLDTVWSAPLRILPVFRGRPANRLRLGVSSSDGLVATSSVSPPDGLMRFDDFPAGDFGFSFAVQSPRFDSFVLEIDGHHFLADGAKSADLRVFLIEREWVLQQGSGAFVYALDRAGTGRLGGVGLVRTNDAGSDEFLLQTDDRFLNRYTFSPRGQLTGSLRTQRAGETVTSAFTTVSPASARVEVGLRRARRPAAGAFTRHGTVGVVLPPATGNTRLVRATRHGVEIDWFAAVLRGGPSTIVAPTDVESAPGENVAVGVPAPLGNLVVADGDSAAGVLTLDRVWLWPDLAVTEGAHRSVTASAALTADTVFLARNALAGLDAAIPASALTFDLAIELPGGNLIDVARGIGGNRADAGVDTRLRLPALAGPLGGAVHVVRFGGAGVAGSAMVRQETLVRIDGVAPADVPMLPLPSIDAPMAGAVVPAAGFTARWTLPADALFATLELEHTSGTSSADWGVIVPATQTSFSFRTLPAPAVTPLEAGAWSLRLTAYRIRSGPVVNHPNPYQRVMSRWFSSSLAEFEVDALSSVEIPLTLQ